MIDKKEVQHIASLARLRLEEKELEKYQKELSSILEYIKKLEEVNTDGVEPTSHPGGLNNVFRVDEARESGKEIAKKLIDLAPDKENGYLKVKSILKRSK
jgi:aspartyl-tRNA(Asn)/glutamyl-tRNA(Gln) amidotransferase subunit C